jgi:hypothetical protein
MVSPGGNNYQPPQEPCGQRAVRILTTDLTNEEEPDTDDTNEEPKPEPDANRHELFAEFRFSFVMLAGFVVNSL